MEQKVDRKADTNDAQIIREMIRHENDLIHHRITWFGTLQGLLFAALAFAWGKNNITILTYLLAMLGIVLSISTYYAIQASLKAIKTLREWWDNNKNLDYVGPDIIGRRPDSKSIPFLRPYVVFPASFLIAWAIILIWQIL
jgi:hypothetical protein